MWGPWEDTPRYGSSFWIYLTKLSLGWAAVGSAILELCFEKVMEDDGVAMEGLLSDHAGVRCFKGATTHLSLCLLLRVMG